MNFSNYFTLDNFKAIFNHSQIDSDKIDDTWRNKNRTLTEENFNIPLVKFLTDIRDSTGLLKIKYSEGHDTRFSQEWNRFIDKKDNLHYVNDSFYMIIIESTMNYDKTPVTDELISDRYNKLADKITNGNFRPSEISNDACQCQDCGQRFKLNIKSWEPTFNVFEKKPDGTLDYRSFVPPESCLDNDTVEVNVNFPTGEIIVADWVRIEEFTKSVEYNGKDKWEPNTSLNFAKGRIFRTEHSATVHNFINVSVGNSSPAVFQNGNSLIVGQHKYDDYDAQMPVNGEYKESAKVCTDLWAVTMIDKQTLINIVATKAGDKANEIVNDYLKTDHNHYIIQVNSGQYNLNFHANYEDFDKKVNNDELPDEIEKFFTVSSSELKQQHKKRGIK